jgi:acyl carrier protein
LRLFMSREEIKNTMQEIFRDVLDNSTLILSDEMKASDVEEWDSLTHIGLVTAIEKHYKIRFSLGELDDLKNVGDMLDAIQKKNNL